MLSYLYVQGYCHQKQSFIQTHTRTLCPSLNTHRNNLEIKTSTKECSQFSVEYSSSNPLIFLCYHLCRCPSATETLLLSHPVFVRYQHFFFFPFPSTKTHPKHFLLLFFLLYSPATLQLKSIHSENLPIALLTSNFSAFLMSAKLVVA